MNVKNIGKEARTLSHAGNDHPLLPGASVDVDLTKDEARAFEALGFSVTGEPVKPRKAEK